MNRSMRYALTLLTLSGPAWGELPQSDLQAALAMAVGERAELAGLPLSIEQRGKVRMQRIEVYAPDARIYEAGVDGLRELPRSNWLHFRADRTQPGAPQLALSLSPDGKEARGVLLTPNGRALAISGTRQGSELAFVLSNARQDASGKEAIFVCEHSSHMRQADEAPSRTGRVATPTAPAGGSRTATVAVDTDNELLQLKFSDNTTSATNYLAQLFAAMTVVYERDLDLTLLQGTTILRTSANPDPYTTPMGADTADQLDEFGTFWQNNQAGVSRAFAMLLSGKSDDPFSSAGIAWVLNGNNYCTSTNAVGGHYSVTQVFRFNGSNASHDVLVVAHEIGHNFGAFHTHCSNATTGVGPTASNTIDTCFSGEPGCFNGPQVCPAPTTVNGVTNVRGTLMAYCHLNGIAGCDSSPVFAGAHRTLLTPRVANNVANGCFTAVGGPNIFANGFE
jgi:hypothetical protein